jgi:flagellar basal body-associated protein FliL
MTGYRPTNSGKPPRQKMLLSAILMVGILIGFVTAYLTFDQRYSKNEKKRSSRINQSALTVTTESYSAAQELSSPSQFAVKSDQRQSKGALTAQPRQSNAEKKQMIMSTPTPETITNPEAARDVAAQVMLALSDPDETVRENAVERLEDVKDESINEPLQRALTDIADSVREEAILIMNGIENPEIILPSLVTAIDSGDPGIAEEALDIISEVQTHQAIDLVIEKGLNNDNSEIREEALSKLGDMTDQDFESAEEAQQWWLENKDTFVFEPVYEITFGSMNESLN